MIDQQPSLGRMVDAGTCRFVPQSLVLSDNSGFIFIFSKLISFSANVLFSF